MKYKILVVFAICLVANTVHATTDCSISNARDVLNCALENAPGVLTAKSSVPIAQIKKDTAWRWQNPEFDGEIGYNRDDYGNKITEADLAILQPIEGLSKRRARKLSANAELSLANISLMEQKEITTIQTLTILNTLRQIDAEKKIIKDAVDTFSKVVNRYKNRPALSPEDKISLDLFNLALNNYRIENQEIIASETRYINALRTSLNTNIDVRKDIFFYPPKSWPDITDESNIEQSTALMKEDVNVEIARAKHAEARASAFGEFKVGPYVKTQQWEFGKVNSYGVRFEMPIPIFTSYQAAKAGRLGIAAAEQDYDSKKRDLSNTLSALKQQYLSGVSLLSEYNIEDLEKKCAQTKKSSESGRVGGALLIEAYRQMLDSMKIYHQYEMTTLQSLWQIYALQKKLLTNTDEVCYEKK